VATGQASRSRSRETAAWGGRRCDNKACAWIEVGATGARSDLEKFYDIAFAMDFAGALRSLGRGEWAIDPPGLRGAAEPIQKPGRPRQYPVRLDRRDALEYEIALVLPRPLTPLLKEEKGETPLRSYAWTAEVTATPAPELRARLVEHRRPAHFGFEQREEGLAAWKKDRTAVRRLREDGLALKEAQ
jgi:hypothetical protein